MSKTYMAIDQYGTVYHGLKHPRKDLMDKLGIKHVEKMYQDDKEGNSYHTGYVIGHLWLNIFEVISLRKLQSWR